MNQIMHIDYQGEHYSVVVSEKRFNKAFKSEKELERFQNECIAKVKAFYNSNQHVLYME